MRTIVSQTLNLSFARLIAVIANILMFSLAARYLEQSSYGMLRKFFIPYDLVASMLTVGMPAGILYLIGKSRSPRAVMFRSVAIVAITCTIYVVVFAAGSGSVFSTYLISSSYALSIMLLGVYAFSQSLQQIIQPFAILPDRSRMLAMNILLSSVALTVASWGVLHAGMGATDLVIVRCVIMLLAALQIMVVIASARDRRILTNPGDTDKNVETMSAIARYCFPLGIASSINAISMSFDKFIVSYGTDEKFYAIYANGAMELPLIGVLVGSVSTVILSEMVRRLGDGDKIGAIELFKKSGSASALIIFPAFFIAFFFAESIMSFLFSDRYQGSAAIFRVYLLVLPVRIVVFGSAIIAIGYGSRILIRSIIELILAGSLGVLLFYMWGPYAVPFGFVIATYLWSVPYNMRLIAQGFEVRHIDIFDLPFLARIGVLCALLTPLLLIPMIVHGPPFVVEAICATLYLAAVALVYTRTKVIRRFIASFTKATGQ